MTFGLSVFTSLGNLDRTPCVSSSGEGMEALSLTFYVVQEQTLLHYECWKILYTMLCRSPPYLHYIID